MTFHAETPKDVGCCSSCDQEVFNIRSRWPDVRGHPFRGRPKDVGLPLQGALRLDFRLSNGTICSFTTCTECERWLLEHEEVWPQLWRKAIREMEYQMQEGVREVLLSGKLGVDPSTEELTETAKTLRAKIIANLRRTQIMEYIKTDRWEDLVHGGFVTT